jgi:hypothetical protein
MKRALLAMMILAVCLPLAAQDSPDPGPGRAQSMIIDFLSLSPEQVAAWEEAFEAHRTAEQPIQESAAQVQAELDELFALTDPDPFEVGELVLERRQLGEDLIEVHRLYVEDFVSLLDEDQAKRYGFIRRAEQAQPLIPAFRLAQLLPPR